MRREQFEAGAAWVLRTHPRARPDGEEVTLVEHLGGHAVRVRHTDGSEHIARANQLVSPAGAAFAAVRADEQHAAAFTRASSPSSWPADGSGAAVRLVVDALRDLIDVSGGDEHGRDEHDESGRRQSQRPDEPGISVGWSREATAAPQALSALADAADLDQSARQEMVAAPAYLDRFGRWHLTVDALRGPIAAAAARHSDEVAAAVESAADHGGIDVATIDVLAEWCGVDLRRARMRLEERDRWLEHDRRLTQAWCCAPGQVNRLQHQVDEITEVVALLTGWLGAAGATLPADELSSRLTHRGPSRDHHVS